MNKSKNQFYTVSNGIIRFRESFPREIKSEKQITVFQTEITLAISEFMECVRYLHTRRTSGTVLKLAGEDDVQDALYIMLRPWIKDLKYEDPGAKVGNRFAIPDFVLPTARMVVEAKYIRDRNHGRLISKELHDDIEMFRNILICDYVLFFIYDPDHNIPSADSLKNDLCVPRTIDGKQLKVNIIIKP